jgi:hypothetical protein
MFKKCALCKRTWATRQDFIDDPDIDIIGYQANFIELETGLLYFNHACKSTLAVPVEFFSDLYSGPMFQERKTGTDHCPGYCLHKHTLTRCPAECECAYVRKIIQLFKKD